MKATAPPGAGLDIQAYGDSALLVRAVQGSRERRWRTVQRLADALEAATVVGVHDLVATYDCLLVEFDCERTSHDAVARAVRQLAARAGGTGRVAAPRRFRVPVVYGGEHGPDLPEVADQLGLTADEVVRRHAGTDWVVRFLGAPAGAPMLDGAAFPTPVSRRPSPRTRVPAGAVAVAGAQAVIYPVTSPGGWRLIGRTPLRLVDVGRWPQVAYRPGDRFRFIPVPASSWADYVGALT